jgi:hypothetical protein
MNFSVIDKIIKFFNWFIDILAKPLGITTWSIVLILAGGYYGEYQREEVISNNKEQTIAANSRIKQLETKIDTLSTLLANRDCTDEIQKYINVIQTIQLQTSQNKEEIQRRLELEKKKTQELQKLKQSLNIK